jgi:hypothetical protein
MKSACLCLKIYRFKDASFSISPRLKSVYIVLILSQRRIKIKRIAYTYLIRPIPIFDLVLIKVGSPVTHFLRLQHYNYSHVKCQCCQSWLCQFSPFFFQERREYQEKELLLSQSSVLTDSPRLIQIVRYLLLVFEFEFFHFLPQPVLIQCTIGCKTNKNQVYTAMIRIKK